MMNHMAETAKHAGPERAEALLALGARVREAREAVGWTQQDLADAIGVNRVEISMIERGDREMGVLRLARIAAALGITPNDLLSAEPPDRRVPQREG